MESMKGFAALLLIALPLIPSQAQRPPRAAAKKSAPAPAAGPPVIRVIDVTGTSVYKPEQVVAISGIRPGDPATKEVFEAARDRVLATGCFESFGWKYELLPDTPGFKATLEITEVAQHYPWALDRIASVTAKEFSERAARELPLFGPKIPASETYMTRAADLLRKMMAERGVTEKVIPRVTLLGKDMIGILFGPATAPPNVAEVRFVGARAVNPLYLVKALSDVAVGTPFLQPNFDMMLEAQIRPMYDATGRMKAAFTKLEVVPSTKVKGVVVTIHVDEGEPYTLSRIEVTGAPLSNDEINQLGAWGLDKQVNFSDIGLGIEKIRDKARQEGYMKIAYTARRQINEEKKTVDVFINFEPGPQYKLGRLLIQGLDLETEPVIRKLFAIKPGEPFRQGYANGFLEEIRQQGIFDNLGETKTKIDVDDARQTVDLTLIFSGQKRPPPKKGLP